MRIGVDVGQLHHVLDVAIVAQDRANRSIEPLVVATHEDFVEGGVAAAHAIDDGFVGELGRGRRHDGLGCGIHPLIPLESGRERRVPGLY